MKIFLIGLFILTFLPLTHLIAAPTLALVVYVDPHKSVVLDSGHLTIDLKLSPYPGTLTGEHVILHPVFPQLWHLYYEARKIRWQEKISHGELKKIFLKMVVDSQNPEFCGLWTVLSRQGFCGFLLICNKEPQNNQGEYLYDTRLINGLVRGSDLLDVCSAVCEGGILALSFIKSNLEAYDQAELEFYSREHETDYVAYLKEISSLF